MATTIDNMKYNYLPSEQILKNDSTFEKIEEENVTSTEFHTLEKSSNNRYRFRMLGDIFQQKFVLFCDDECDKYNFVLKNDEPTTRDINLFCKKMNNYYILETENPTNMINLYNFGCYYDTYIICDHELVNAKIYTNYFYYMPNREFLRNCPYEIIFNNSFEENKNIVEVSHEAKLTGDNCYTFKFEHNIYYIKVKSKNSDVVNGFIDIGNFNLHKFENSQIKKIMDNEFFDLCQINENEVIFPLKYITKDLLPSFSGIDPKYLKLYLDNNNDDYEFIIGYVE